MSALPDDAGHFVRWLQARGVADAASALVPRLTYGAYLHELLYDARIQARNRIHVIHGDAVDLVQGMHTGVRLADGRLIEADATVLAVGNLPPHDPPGLPPGGLPASVYKGDPWSADVANGLRPDDRVLLIGSGLTMVDVALKLEADGFAGQILAVSRRGLLPRAHAAGTPPWDRLRERGTSVASQRLREVRERGHEIG